MRAARIVPSSRYSEGPKEAPSRAPESLQRIVRVDHAGEYAADRIYAGQMAVLRDKTPASEAIREMWETEKEHLVEFERVMRDKRVRPTALLPVWNLAGFAVGAGSALLGTKAAMACTVAVEEVIEEHYNDQLRILMNDENFDDSELLNTISKIRDDEVAHRDAGSEFGGKEAMESYPSVTNLLKMGLRTAIWLSERF